MGRWGTTGVGRRVWETRETTRQPDKGEGNVTPFPFSPSHFAVAWVGKPYQGR
ncbi:MAG: hypothetical protein ACHBN1_12065 [Heteroscytonema crispum UTEX LB 1556]